MANLKFRKIARTSLLFVEVSFFLVFSILGFRGWYLYEKNSDFLEIIREVQSKSYSSSYQCLDFSRDLSLKLSQKGIANSIAIVEDGSPESYHAVVSVQIEPQDSQVADYPVVDYCRTDGESLVCQNGFLIGRNGYVADRRK